MRIGAYAVEKDYSHYVSYAAKTVLAVVGTASKGPIGEAVVCTSTQDLVNKFGILNPAHYAMYAAQYFLSQSSKVYFVRAASESVKAASVVINNADTSSAAITVTALESGTYANGYTVSVSAGASSTSSAPTYNISLLSKSGVVLEEIGKDISLEDLKSATSKYVSITVQNAAAELVATTYTLAGGNDGENPTDDDYITAVQALIADTLDMNLIAVPGVSTYTVIESVLAVAETRGDCFYIVDAPQGLTKEGVAAWHNAQGESALPAALDSSYGALYYDWVDIYDSVNKKTVQVPPSVVVAATYAYSDRTTEFWYAPAGLTRGVIRGAIGTATKLNKTDVDVLYSEGNRINSIYEDPQVGLVLWGQKTLQRADTALNRVNVRRLMNYLKRVVTAACNYLTFEPNDRLTWDSFEMKVQPVLENIKSKRGIYEYRIIKGEAIVTDNDIDNYRMPCMILIRPTKAAEEIPIYFAITSTGADFNDVLENSGLVIE